MRRILAMAVLALTAVRASNAQLVYDATQLVHGLNDNGNRWLYPGPQGQTPLQLYSAQVNLK